MLRHDNFLSTTVCETVTESATASRPSPAAPFITAVPKRRKSSPTAREPSRDPWRPAPQKQDKALAFFEDIPEVLQFNKYIRSGYRTGFTNWECARSVLRVHNETCNIWTHLLPLLVWVGSVMSGVYKPWDAAPGIFYMSTISTCVCLAGSVMYHTFIGCHCSYHKWLLLDVFGIYVMTMSTQWFIFSAGFACSPAGRIASIGMYYGFGAFGMWYAFQANSALKRGLPMLGLSLIRLSVLATRPIVGGCSIQAFWVYLLAEVLAITGGMLNVVRFPEKWYQPKRARVPGRFDVLGHSHQLMHVFVLGTMVCAQVGLGMDVRYFHSGEATCPV